MLQLAAQQLTQLCAQAQESYPEECCGLLLGQAKRVVKLWPTENVWTPNFGQELQVVTSKTTHLESRHNRFAIAPEAILQAQKYARHHQLSIIGIYHSHPDYPAIPSEYDRAIAWDIYSYLILSVEQRQVSAYRSWVLDGDRQFQEEPIQISDAETAK